VRRVKRLVMLGCLLLAACGAPEPRAVSTYEAARLAQVRFNNYSSRVSSVDARIPSPAGALLLSGRIDFVAHVGYVTLNTEGRRDPASAGLLQWGPTLMAFREGVEPAADVPPDGWQYRPLQKDGSELDAALLILINMAADRPDDAQALERSARWLRSDRVGDRTVDVLDTGRLTYWVDQAGQLLRLQARLGEQAEPAVITFSSGAAPFAALPELG
jgi:hypothetical protein